MSPRERQIIKEIKPLVDAGNRGWAMRVYQNLTTHRKRKPKCLFCGNPVLNIAGKKRFDSVLCFQMFQRKMRGMKKLIPLTALCLLACSAFASPGANSTMTFGWTNGDNPTANTNWVTIVSYGISPGVYTNSVTVPYSQTTVTISNLVSATRYYASAQHSDGMDTSVPSNEANAKTKINKPTSATAQTP